MSTDKDLMSHWTTPWHPAAGDPIRIDVLSTPNGATYLVYNTPEGFAGSFMTFEHAIGTWQKIRLDNYGGKVALSSVRFANPCPAPAG